MSANKRSFPDPLTNPETPALDSPVAGRGRGTAGGGGKTVADARALMGARLGYRTSKALQMKVLNYPGCGNKEHGHDCLCDVVIKNTVPIGVSFPHDITFASLICEHMGFEAPYSVNDFIDALAMSARAKDMLSDPRHELQWRDDQKVPHDARLFMRECAEAGMRNKDVREAVLDGWGVEVSAAYVSKRRYLYTGEKGSKK